MRIFKGKPYLNSWTFYYMFKEVAPTKKRSSYFAGLKRIFTIDCIEDFWKYFV